MLSLLTAALPLGLGPFAQGPAPLSGELFPNGGMERNDGRTIPGFDLSEFGVSLDRSQAHTGAWSIKAQGDGGHASLFTTGRISLGGVTQKPRRLRIGAWVKADHISVLYQGGWTTGQVRVFPFDASGKKMDVRNANGFPDDGLGDLAGFFSGTFDWRPVEATVVVPPGAASIELQGGLGCAVGTAWFDDFSVREMPLAVDTPEDDSATLVVDPDRLVGLPVEGVGWNWCYVWDRANEVGIKPDFLDSLVHFAEWDGQSFARFGFLAQRCLAADMRSTEPRFDAQKPDAVLYRRILGDLNRLGVQVMACNWQYGDGHAPYPNAPHPAGRFADSLTTVLDQWVNVDGFKNVRWISLWNEPDWWYRQGGDYRKDFPFYWRVLHDRLVQANLGGKVGIVGGDTTQGGSIAAIAFPDLDAKAPRSLGAWSAHDYFSSLEAPSERTGSGVMTPFLDGYRSCAQALASRGESLFVGEFGCDKADPELNFRGTLGEAELVVGGLNAGVRGFARWMYNQIDVPSDQSGFSPFRNVDGKLAPNRANYYGYALLTKSVRHGARVAGLTLKGGRDANGVLRVYAASLSYPDGGRTLVVVNDGSRPKTVRVEGLGSRKSHHYWYDATLPDGLQQAKDVDLAKETVTVRPMSVNAFTTWPFDRLKP